MKRDLSTGQELNRARRAEPIDLIPRRGSVRGAVGREMVSIRKNFQTNTKSSKDSDGNKRL